jgi:predicted amidohydrolase
MIETLDADLIVLPELFNTAIFSQKKVSLNTLQSLPFTGKQLKPD